MVFLCAYPRVGEASCIRLFGTRSPRGETFKTSFKLEHAMPAITPHANGKPLLKQSSFLATILLVVWSANGDGSALRLVPIY